VDLLKQPSSIRRAFIYLSAIAFVQLFYGSPLISISLLKLRIKQRISQAMSMFNMFNLCWLQGEFKIIFCI